MVSNSWNVIAFSGVGPLHFGCTRSEVRSVLGGDPALFRKGANAPSETDAYDELGFHLHYDLEDRLECIEAFGSCSISFRNVPLLQVPLGQVIDELAKLGLTYRYDDGYFFDQAGFVLQATETVVDDVTVYRKGYYDRDGSTKTGST